MVADLWEMLVEVLGEGSNQTNCGSQAGNRQQEGQNDLTKGTGIGINQLGEGDPTICGDLEPTK